MLTKARTRQDFNRSSASAIRLTESLRHEPHDPYTLNRRAFELLSLGYPELAAGDAFKAKSHVEVMMIEFADKHHEMSFDEGRNHLEHMLQWHFEAYNNLMSALSLTGDYKSLLELCEEGRERYDDKRNIEHILHSMTYFKDSREVAIAQFDTKKKRLEQTRLSRDGAQMRLESGFISHFAYPFTPEKYANRQIDLIASTKKLFTEASSSCMLGYCPNSLSSNSPEQNSSKALGVFATQDIKFAERLVEDTTMFAASTVNAAAPSTPKSVPNSSRICDNCYGDIPTLAGQLVPSKCCHASYCSARCRDMALASYHSVLCRQNFDWVYEESSRGNQGQSVLNSAMWLRILAVCVQSDCHPLDHPSIARLTPLHDKSGRIWTLSNNIITPIRILKQLGINPIEDFRYDTWILQTIWTRVINNQVAHTTPDGRQVRAINPLYSFFNHSCEPNTGWSATDTPTCRSGSTKDVFARRSVKKGEELCIAYSKLYGSESKAARQEIMKPWIGVDKECRCTKCQRGDSDESTMELRPVDPVELALLQCVHVFRC